jgi:hypothetical protein
VTTHDPRALLALLLLAPVVLALGVAYVRASLATTTTPEEN